MNVKLPKRSTSTAPNAQCTVCWKKMRLRNPAAAKRHILREHPYLADAEPLDQFVGLDGRPLAPLQDPSEYETIRERVAERAKQAASTVAWGLLVAVLESRERRPDHVETGDDGGYFVKDADGNLQPYDAQSHGLYVEDSDGTLRRVS
jgi:hypothetical protein